MTCMAVGQFLVHHQIRATARALADGKIVGKGAHQENPAAGGPQEILLCQRIGNFLKLESATLIANVNDHVLRFELDGQQDFLLLVLAVAVVVGVDHALTNGHAKLVNFVLAVAGGFGHTHNNAFGQIHAV